MEYIVVTGDKVSVVLYEDGELKFKARYPY